MKKAANPKPWKARVIIVFLGATIVFMSFYTISLDRWAIVSFNPPPGAKGIEPTLWLTLMGLVLILVGVYPWEPLHAPRKRAKRKQKVQASKSLAPRFRRAAPRRKLLA